MIKINRKIRNYILNKLARILPEIQYISDQQKLNSLGKQFKSIGKNYDIVFPVFLGGHKYISIGDNFYASNNLRLEAIDTYAGETFSPKIVIGNNVMIQVNCHVGAVDEVNIGDNVLIASNVYISDHFHGEIKKEELNIPPSQRRLSTKGPVIIHKNVWIGDSVCILPGVTIGENAIIGANSVVTKSIPANAVVAGVPAVVIKQF